MKKKESKKEMKKHESVGMTKEMKHKEKMAMDEYKRLKKEMKKGCM